MGLLYMLFGKNKTFSDLGYTNKKHLLKRMSKELDRCGDWKDAHTVFIKAGIMKVYYKKKV